MSALIEQCDIRAMFVCELRSGQISCRVGEALYHDRLLTKDVTRSQQLSERQADISVRANMGDKLRLPMLLKLAKLTCGRRHIPKNMR